MALGRLKYNLLDVGTPIRVRNAACQVLEDLCLGLSMQMTLLTSIRISQILGEDLVLMNRCFRNVEASIFLRQRHW